MLKTNPPNTSLAHAKIEIEHSTECNWNGVDDYNTKWDRHTYPFSRPAYIDVQSLHMFGPICQVLIQVEKLTTSLETYEVDG